MIDPCVLTAHATQVKGLFMKKLLIATLSLAIWSSCSAMYRLGPLAKKLPGISTTLAKRTFSRSQQLSVLDRYQIELCETACEGVKKKRMDIYTAVTCLGLVRKDVVETLFPTLIENYEQLAREFSGDERAALIPPLSEAALFVSKMLANPDKFDRDQRLAFLEGAKINEINYKLMVTFARR